MNDLSTLLTMVIILTLMLALATWYSPKALRYLAALLDTRSFALAAYRDTFKCELKLQQEKRGL